MNARMLSSRSEASCSGRTVCLHSESSSLAATAFSRPAGSRRCFRRGPVLVECKESRIGKQPVKVPQGVTVTVGEGLVTCKAQKGEMQSKFNSKLVEIKETEEKGVYKVRKLVESRQANMTHGLVRALFNNMVEGLSTGFTKTLTLIGVGYRAVLDGKNLQLNLGYSNPVIMAIPEGVEVKVERATTVHISGYDKAVVGQFAADVRSKRPPEPYKGKGVRYRDEYVPKKEGKRGKK